MNFKRLILFLLCLLNAYFSYSQRESGLIQSRVLILLDESSSMIQPWASGKEKYKAAREIIMKLMDSVYAVNRDVEFSLRVFGHQHTVPENDCYDTRNEVPFSRDNRYQMAARLDDIHPLGVTPIAFALTEAADKDLTDVNTNAYSIILITDGGESCGGDICEVMKKLIKYKVYFKPYIVSLENDPSLRVTYSCMGDFLQVTKEKDIPKAVSTIVTAFRPVIKISASDYQDVQNIAAKAPSVLKVNKPEIKPDSEPAKKTTARDTALLTIVPRTSMLILKVSPPAMDKLEIEEQRIQLPTVIADIPFSHPVVKIESVIPAPVKLKVVSNPAPDTKIKIVNLDISLPKVVADTIAKRPADLLSKLKLAALNTFSVIFVIEDHTYAMRQIPSLPPFKADQPATKPVPDVPQKHEFHVETVDDRETTVSVYFTNGQGKFYNTSPQVILLDAATKQPVRKFFRTVDPSGNPDPQSDIPPGTYDLTLAGRPDYMLNSIVIAPHKNNKITVLVKKTTLSFAYENALGRQVKEFSAEVTERNKSQGRVQDQKCTEKLLYETGNYHIEINTFPRDVRNVDLDFDGETVITIPQPGFAKFTGDGSIHNVTLYRQYGDKFLSFYPMDLNDPKSQSQHLQMQPGSYQVHYQKGPIKGSVAEQVVPFMIKATQVTEITIK